MWYTRTPGGRIYTILIRDKANVAPPRRGPRVELQPLNENFVDTVELEQEVDPVTLESYDTTPAKSAHAACRAPSSS